MAVQFRPPPQKRDKSSLFFVVLFNLRFLCKIYTLKKGGYMNVNFLKDLLLKFAIDRVNDIAKQLVLFAIDAINRNETTDMLEKIKNPVHKEIAKMVINIVEETLKTIQGKELVVVAKSKSIIE